jgi:hypothetical protein
MTDVYFGDAGAIITEAATDEMRREFIGKENNLVFQTIEKAHRFLRRAGERYNYLVESVIESLEMVSTDERGGTLAINFGWAHPQAERYEYGTSAHTIQGDPILAFVWEDRHDPPGWVREQFDRARSDRGFGGYLTFLREVEVDGIKEIRFARRALDWLERELARRGGT